MIIQIDETGTVEGLINAINNTLKNKDLKSLFIMSCNDNGYTPDNIDSVLKEISIPIFGGIFPAIIHDERKMDKGTIVVGMSREINVEVIPRLSDEDADYDEMLEEKIPEVGTMKTMIVFVDGFAKRIGTFIESLFNVFGLEINYFGGGAGSLSMKQKHCLFTNDGLIQDAAILALLDLASGIGVSHGWKSIKGPYRVTESDRNIVKTIEWKPAFDFYRDIVEKHSGESFKEDDFFGLAKSYPFGIAKMGTERIVRDPILVGDENSLVCVGEVPEGAFIDLLNGDHSSLIEAAGKALAISVKAFKGPADKKICIFMDCISRVLFFGEKFNEEMEEWGQV